MAIFGSISRRWCFVYRCEDYRATSQGRIESSYCSSLTIMVRSLVMENGIQVSRPEVCSTPISGHPRSRALTRRQNQAPRVKVRLSNIIIDSMKISCIVYSTLPSPSRVYSTGLAYSPSASAHLICILPVYRILAPWVRQRTPRRKRARHSQSLAYI